MTRFFSLMILLLVSLVAGAKSVPFQIEIEPVNAVAVPAVHSSAFTQQGSKWLTVGGHTSGLHGFSTNDNFDVMYANDAVRLGDIRGKILAGNLYGGIEAYRPDDQPSITNDSIFRVYLTPDPVLLSTLEPASQTAEVFPNPATENILINVPEQGTTLIEIRKSPGQLVQTHTINGTGTVIIPVDRFAKGNYTVTLKAPSGTRTYPITVTH